MSGLRSPGTRRFRLCNDAEMEYVVSDQPLNLDHTLHWGGMTPQSLLSCNDWPRELVAIVAALHLSDIKKTGVLLWWIQTVAEEGKRGKGLAIFKPLCVESVATPQSDGQITIQRHKPKRIVGNKKGEENQLQDSCNNKHPPLTGTCFFSSWEHYPTVSLSRGVYCQWLRFIWGTNNSPLSFLHL